MRNYILCTLKNGLKIRFENKLKSNVNLCCTFDVTLYCGNAQLLLNGGGKKK